MINKLTRFQNNVTGLNITQLCLGCNISARQHYKLSVTSRQHPDMTWNAVERDNKYNSGLCLLLTEGIVPTLRAVSLKYHTAITVIWYLVTLIWQWVNHLIVLNYPLYVQYCTREFKLPIWNLWFDSAMNRTRDFPDTEWMLYHYATDAGIASLSKQKPIRMENKKLKAWQVTK